MIWRIPELIEKIKKISNPLTIIAIFAGLAEVAGTVALGLVSEKIQLIFIWFVMGFPILLVVCFFITLNFNPKVLYAPSDFSNEDNFLQTLTGSYKIGEEIKEISEFVNASKSEISKVVGDMMPQQSENITDQSTHGSSADKDATIIKIAKELDKIQNKLKDVEVSTEQLAIDSLKIIPIEVRRNIIDYLALVGRANVDTIADALGISKGKCLTAITRMMNAGLLKKSGYIDDMMNFEIA